MQSVMVCDCSEESCSMGWLPKKSRNDRNEEANDGYPDCIYNYPTTLPLPLAQETKLPHAQSFLTNNAPPTTFEYAN